jgi:hypothetical protein
VSVVAIPQRWVQYQSEPDTILVFLYGSSSEEFLVSAVATITINDGQATPVAHNFIPLGQDKNGVWWFEDQSPSFTLGYNRISVGISRTAIGSPGANSGNRVNRVKLGIHTPKLETLGTADNGIIPPPTLAYIPRVNLEFILSERAVLQDRKDVLAYAVNLLANTQVVAMVQTLQPIY